MRVAILHEGNHETPITADEYRSRFGARGGHSTWLTCPECGQPVVTRAMASYSLVDPYFKHENDNPISQECPNYVSGGDGYSYDGASVALGEPLEMSIEYEGSGLYHLLVEFPLIDSWALDFLKERDAVISFGGDEYRVRDGDFDYYTELYYAVDGPSFGLGLELEGAPWPYETPMPNIEHTLNGCMLFEALDVRYYGKRLNARNLDLYDSDRFLLAYSTVSGMRTASLIEGLSERFRVAGWIFGSEEGDDEIRIARFTMSNRSVLKALFP